MAFGLYITHSPIMVQVVSGGSGSKESACNKGGCVRSLSQKDPLEKAMVTYSSILVWKIPSTEEPGGLYSTGYRRVRHDRATNTSTFQSWYKVPITHLRGILVRI